MPAGLALVLRDGRRLRISQGVRKRPCERFLRPWSRGINKDTEFSGGD